MERRTIVTDRAPAARGCYSQGMIVGPFLFTAGQLPLDPATGQLVPGGIAEQTERVLKNIQGIVEAAGGALRDVVKVTVFIADIAEWGALNEVYARFFPADPPARTVVAAKELHYGAHVEMEAVAYIPAQVAPPRHIM